MNKEEKIIKKLIEHDEKFKEIREEMATKKDHNKVMDALDFVVKKLDNIEHAFVSNLAAHDRFEEAINNLNSRVSQLEKRK